MDAWSSSASLFSSRASPFCAVRSLVPPWVFAPFLPRECPRCALSSAFSVASRRFSDLHRASSSDGERPDPVRSLASAATASSRSAISRSSSRLASILEASGMGASAAREFDADDGAEVVRSDSDDAPMPPSDWPPDPSCSIPFSSTHVSLLSIFSIRFILASDDEGDAGAFPGLSLLGLRSGFAASVFKSRTLLRTVLNEVAISNSNVGSPAGECVGDREDA